MDGILNGKTVLLAVGFFVGLVLAHWIKIFGAQYLWILFYR